MTFIDTRQREEVFQEELEYGAHSVYETPGSKYLEKAKQIQIAKSHDYQNPNSSIKQADHYPHGVTTIYDMVWQKMIRIRSLLEAMEAKENEDPRFPKFESVEDSVVDAINYLSFLAVYLNGEMDGQSQTRDIFNREIRKC
jgi:hypothetical protein